jgi:hypothetical protein
VPGMCSNGRFVAYTKAVKSTAAVPRGPSRCQELGHSDSRLK